MANVVLLSSITYEICGIELPKSFNHGKLGLPLSDPAFLRNSVSIPTVCILLGVEYYERCILNNSHSIGVVTFHDT